MQSYLDPTFEHHRSSERSHTGGDVSFWPIIIIDLSRLEEGDWRITTPYTAQEARLASCLVL